MEKALVGRQPIFDKHGDIFAYELLFRDSDQNSTHNITDNRFATAKVLSESFNAIGLDRILGQHAAVVNVTTEFILDDVIETIPPKRFILKLTPHADISSELLDHMMHLKERGYCFASIVDTDTSFETADSFYRLIDIALVDMTRMQKAEDFKKLMTELSRYELELLAEKVEDEAIHEYCKRNGFSYFQGYFFARPKIVESRKIDPGQGTLIKIIEKINSGCSIGEIEDAFSYNPELTVNMLRYINSSHFNTKKEISSIPQAVNMMGRHTLVQWLTLSLYSSSQSNRYKESILQTVMLRAEIMFSLVRRYKMGMDTANKAYLIGLLSLLHALLHIPRPMIFKEIPFDTEVTGAVLGHEGKLGKFLKIVMIFEQGEVPKIQAVLQKIKMQEDELSDLLSTCYVNVINRHAAL